MMGASERRDDWPHANWRGGRVVYCGGLENRFGFTADGGSNPSLSAIFLDGNERIAVMAGESLDIMCFE